MRKSEGYFNGVGGIRLFYRAWEVTRARAGITVIHGLGEHSGRYEALAHRLSEYGYSCYALDLRGHGLSDGRRGHAPRFDLLLQDVDRFRREVEGLTDLGCPIFLLGHSLGGLVALRYLQEFDPPLAGGILVSPWLATAAPLPRWKTTLATLLSSVLPTLPLTSGLNPEHVCRDPAVVRAYRDDPLVHSRITPRLFTEISNAMHVAMRRGDRLRLPLLFMIAGADRLVVSDQTEQFVRSLSTQDVTMRVYSKAYHEVLNEPDRMRAIHDLHDWVAVRLGLPDRQKAEALPLHALR